MKEEKNDIPPKVTIRRRYKKELREEEREGVNATMKRRHKRRARRRRQGKCGIQKGKGKSSRAVKTGLSLLKRLAKSKIGKKVTKNVRGKTITSGPSLYEKGVSTVKKRRVRNVLNFFKFINIHKLMKKKHMKYPHVI